MGIFNALFARHKNASIVDQAIVGSRMDVVIAAEQKLGRRLSLAEQQGIERISSVLVLESCAQAFSSPLSTPADVLADLNHFAQQRSTKAPLGPRNATE